MDKIIVDLYKHRKPEESKDWQYSCWVGENSYRGPYDSIQELADAICFKDLINVRLVSKRERSIESGEQIAPLSDDELAELHHNIKETRRFLEVILSN